MVKKITSLNLDSEVVEKAKKKYLNLSEIAEKALKEKLNLIETEINDSITHCEFCGREEEKATKENLNGLTWLWPDEKWICSHCLKTMRNHVISGKRY